MRLLLAAASLAMLCAPATALATTIADATGDWALRYTAPVKAADLDVTSFSVNYDLPSQVFTIGATFAAAIDPTTPGVYVFGVNTGTGTSAPFTLDGAPGVRFNQTFSVTKALTATIGGNALSVTPASNGFSVLVPLSALNPSTGFAPEQYLWNLWPRTGTGPGTFVTDFAPNDGGIAAVPEPATWGMLAIGFGAIGAMVRRRRAGGLRTA